MTPLDGHIRGTMYGNNNVQCVDMLASLLWLR